MKISKLLISTLISITTLNAFEVKNKELYRDIISSKMNEIKDKEEYSNKFIATIEINEKGNFSYKIKEKSHINSFNKKIIERLNKQTKIKYPIIKKNDSIRADVVFEAKIKNKKEKNYSTREELLNRIKNKEKKD